MSYKTPENPKEKLFLIYFLRDCISCRKGGARNELALWDIGKSNTKTAPKACSTRRDISKHEILILV